MNIIFINFGLQRQRDIYTTKTSTHTLYIHTYIHTICKQKHDKVSPLNLLFVVKGSDLLLLIDIFSIVFSSLLGPSDLLWSKVWTFIMN